MQKCHATLCQCQEMQGMSLPLLNVNAAILVVLLFSEGPCKSSCGNPDAVWVSILYLSAAACVLGSMWYACIWCAAPTLGCRCSRRCQQQRVYYDQSGMLVYGVLHPISDVDAALVVSSSAYTRTNMICLCMVGLLNRSTTPT